LTATEKSGSAETHNRNPIEVRSPLAKPRGLFRVREGQPNMRCVHFVGFRGDEYLSALRAFGPPHFIHRGWDLRALREIADGDLIVFATGPADEKPSLKSFDDIRE
jgi:hypothetical protein